MPSAAPTARLEARISTELHAMLKRAAEFQGRTLTDFVVTAVQDAAQGAIEHGEVVRLSLVDRERLAQAPSCPRRTRRRPWIAPSRVAASCYNVPRRHKSRPDPRALLTLALFSVVVFRFAIARKSLLGRAVK